MAFSTEKNESYEVTDKVLTVPNIISLARLLLVPIYLVLLFSGFRVAALVVFVIAAASDFVDGQVARRTNQVSKLGKLLDPAVDTVLMLTGVIGVVAVDELPAWFAVYIFAREAFLLIGGGALMLKFNLRVPVIYIGKFATTFLFVGFAGMFLGVPVADGLGIAPIWWLPGLNSQPYIVWVWVIYIGIILQVIVTVYYCWKAYRLLKEQAASGHERMS